MTALLRATSGFMLWAAAFSTIYAMEGFGCAIGLHQVKVGPTSLLRVALISFYALFILTALYACLRLANASSARLQHVSLGLSAAGCIAIIYTLTPVFLRSICL